MLCVVCVCVALYVCAMRYPICDKILHLAGKICKNKKYIGINVDHAQFPAKS